MGQGQFESPLKVSRRSLESPLKVTYSLKFWEGLMATVPRTIRLKPNTYKQVEQLAEREGKTFSSACDELIETALNERKEVLGISLIDSAINRILARHFRTLSDRMSRLLARTLLESMTNRVLMLQLLGHHLGEDKARAFNQLAYQNSVKNSKKPVVELEEVLLSVAGKAHFETNPETETTSEPTDTTKH